MINQIKEANRLEDFPYKYKHFSFMNTTRKFSLPLYISLFLTIFLHFLDSPTFHSNRDNLHHFLFNIVRVSVCQISIVFFTDTFLRICVHLEIDFLCYEYTYAAIMVHFGCVRERFSLFSLVFVK